MVGMHRVHRFVLVCVSVLISATICKPAVALDTVVLQLRWDHQYQFAGYYAALWQGYYAQEGLEVDIRSAFQPSGEILKVTDEVASGRADFGVGAADILIANDRGKNLTVVTSIFQSSATAFYYRPDTVLRSVSDIAKLKVARRVNDLLDVELQALLKAEGIDPTRIPAHPHQAGIEHLLNGRVDLLPGYTISLPFEAQKRGVRLRQLKPSTYGINFYGDSLFTRRDLAIRNPDLIERFRRATIKGWRYALDNSANMAGRIAFALPRLAPLEKRDRFAFNIYQSEGVRALTHYPEVEVGNLNAERWRRMHDVLKDLGVVKSTFDRRATIFDPKYESDLKKHLILQWLVGGTLVFAFLLIVFVLWTRVLKLQVKSRTEELEHFSALFEAVFNDVPDAMVVTDTECNIIMCNPSLTRMFGYSPDELQGQNLVLLYENVENFEHEERRCFNLDAPPRTAPYEVRYRRQNDEIFPGETVGSPIRNHAGDVIAFICVIRDITTRKKAKEALELSEKRLRTIIDTVPSMIFVKNAEGRFLACNKAMAENYDLSVDDVIGRRQAALHKNHDEVRHMMETDRHVLQSGSVQYYEQEAFRNEDGRTKWLQTVKAACAEHVFGEPAVIGSAVDITVLKETEDELRRVIAEAEQANKAKSEFLASMSHELRTPLNAILGFAQMLQYDLSNPLSPAQIENVGHILDGGEHLLELVNEVLDLERIEANEYTLMLDDVDAGEILSECVEQAVPLGNARSIQISNKFRAIPVVKLRTDPARFKQILINLLSNAIRYNRDGGTVVLDGEVTQDHFLRISVTDTGIGIPESDRTQVFQMFHRVGASAYVAREGTGIGLSVAKLLVERLAGHIGLESEEGVGSTFWFELPLTSNQETLIWGDSMRVGVEEIDQDHQTLIALLNKTTKPMVDEDEVNEVLWDLLEYTRYHFRREEAIMEACGYDNIVGHKLIHKQLTDQVNDIIEQWKREHDPEILRRLRVLLRNWLVDHIMNVDITIAGFTKGKRKAIVKALEEVS